MKTYPSSPNDSPPAPFYLMVGEEKCLADSREGAITISQIIECPLKPGHRGARRREKLDLVVPCSRPRDFIFTWMSECLIQSSVLRALKHNQITGFETRPAHATIEKTGAILDVAELMVTGWGGIADERSGIREIERCPGCGLVRYSGVPDPTHILNPASWDGSDIFMVWPLPLYRFVTERFVQLVRDSGFNGVSFVQAFPALKRGVSSGFTPGRLSRFMPLSRARLLGKDLDIA
jgi:hypothetical protein